MRKLLFSVTKKDLVVEYFSGTGAGGQYRNRHKNCVRIKHPESGALVTGQSHRNKQANIKEALNNLLKNPKFKLWHSLKVMEVLSEETVEESVNKLMDEKYMKFEVKDEKDRWVEISGHSLGGMSIPGMKGSTP